MRGAAPNAGWTSRVTSVTPWPCGEYRLMGNVSVLDGRVHDILSAVCRTRMCRPCGVTAAVAQWPAGFGAWSQVWSSLAFSVQPVHLHHGTSGFHAEDEPAVLRGATLVLPLIVITQHRALIFPPTRRRVLRSPPAKASSWPPPWHSELWCPWL